MRGRLDTPPVRAARPLPARLGRYMWERFPPLAYGPLLVAFTAGGSAAAAAAVGHSVWLDGRTLLALALVTLVFLRLRLTDDLADLGADLAGRPERPLPRGLVSAGELTVLAALAAGGAMVLAAWLGVPVLVAVLAAMGVSLATAWSDRIWGRRPGPVVDALRHSPIVPLIMVGVWFARPGAPLGGALAGIVLLAWGAGLALEVGRKTRGPEEEQLAVVTYSGAHGPVAAAALAVVALGVGAVGGAGWALAVSGVPWPPLLMVVAVAVVAATTVRRPRLGRLRAAVALGVLALLAWPVIIAVLRVGGPA